MSDKLKRPLFELVDVQDELPQKDGKYFILYERYLANDVFRDMEGTAVYHVKSKNWARLHFSKVVTHWLKEVKK